MTREQKRLVFIQAHRLARKHNAPGDCYAVTFGAALRLVLASSRHETTPTGARKAPSSIVRFAAVLSSIFVLLAVVGLFAAAGIIGEATATVVSLAIIWACCPTNHSRRTGQ